MKDQAKLSLKTWIVLIVVFVLGCVTGVGIDGVYRSKKAAPPQESRAREREAMFEKMRRDLSLTDEQSKEMHRVLDETAGEFRTLRSELRPKYEDLRRQTRGRMRALLTEEQQKKFDALMAEIDARRQNNDRGGN